MSGGLARSSPFNHMQADTYNLPVVGVREPETAALGAHRGRRGPRVVH